VEWWQALEWALASVAALVVLACIGLFVRRRLLSGHGGVFDCGMRTWRSAQAGSWAMGMARYQGEVFQWYRAFSLRPSPAAQWARGEMRVGGQRFVDDMEALALFADHVVVTVETVGDQPRRELSMSPESLTGLMSWLEAAPPGGVNYRVAA